MNFYLIHFTLISTIFWWYSLQSNRANYKYDEKETNLILWAFNNDSRKQTTQENNREIMEEQDQLQMDHRNQIEFEGISDYNRGLKGKGRHTQGTTW